MNVVAHEGVNMLGGRDIDRLILQEVVHPWLRANFKLPDGFGADKRYDRLARVARLAAERAKVELSSRTETVVSASDDLVRLEDEAGEAIYLDAPLSRARLEAMIEPIVARTAALSRAIVEDAGYALSDISRVVLIGGPTKMPLLRARIATALGVAVEDPGRVDPMTAVAMGAAIYADSRDWSGVVSAPKPRRAAAEATGGEIAIGYDYDARTAGGVGQAADHPARGAGGRAGAGGERAGLEQRACGAGCPGRAAAAVAGHGRQPLPCRGVRPRRAAPCPAPGRNGRSNAHRRPARGSRRRRPSA